MTDLLDGFKDFAEYLMIPSKEEGVRPLMPLWGTQRYALDELERGLDDGIHYFLFLKGRQQGISTLFQAVDLWWPQTYENLQGQVVVESDDTFASFRDVIREMQDALPPSYRRATYSDNDKMMVFRRDDGRRGSRLMYQVADSQKKKQGRLGRSRGLNYLHATEMGQWTDEDGAKSLEDSCAEQHPQRLYVWEGTAGGYGLWKDMWDGAEDAVTQRRVFIGWWRLEKYAVALDSELFRRYGEAPPSESERLWINAIQAEYNVAIRPEQLAWYRYQLYEKKRGDEAYLAQEHPCLPDDAFQAFGEKFFPTGTLREYRDTMKRQSTPTCLRFAWTGDLDRSDVRRVDPRLMKDEGPRAWVYAEPDPAGLYVIGARPARSSDPESPWSVLQVCRAYPDRLEQVAEYASDTDAVFQFAWAILYFAGAYRMIGHTWLLVELSGTGRAVLQLLHEYQRRGYGFSAGLRARRGDLMDVRGCFQHYVFRRPDTYQAKGSTTMHWEDTPKYGPWLWNGLRDEMERRTVEIKSPLLLDQMATIRRGEEGNSDMIGGGGRQEEGRAYAMALANECWTRFAVYDARIAVAPKAPDPKAPQTVEHRLVQDFLANLDKGPAKVSAR